MITELAPAKINLLLKVGTRRTDGLHELCSLFASVDLCDEVLVAPTQADSDRISCPGLRAPNTVEVALSVFRRASPLKLEPLAITIKKRIPVAAGLGGGSADAAAVLRVANRLVDEPFDTAALQELALEVGSDVPSQIAPRNCIVTGVGERVEAVALSPMAVVLLPDSEGLSTASVYREAERLGLTKNPLSVTRARALARLPLGRLGASLENDLQPAALSLRPALAERITALEARGALGAQLTGSGPTAFGVFDDLARARHAACDLPGAIAVSVL